MERIAERIILLALGTGLACMGFFGVAMILALCGVGS